MAPRVVLSLTPGDDPMFEAKVREAIRNFDGPIEWSNEDRARAIEDEVRKTHPDVEVMVTDHPLNPPTWIVYRHGAPRRIHLE
jgi:hypothetical protein